MRIIETENFTRALSRLSLGKNPECVQIGANDGVGEGAKPSGKDYLFKFLMENKEWRALLIEPVPSAFDALRINYANRPERTAFLNCAISDQNGRQKIQLNGGNNFRTSTLVPSSRNEKKDGFGGYLDIPVLTYQLACEVAGFRDVKFVKIDAENMDRLIVGLIIKIPLFGKLPAIIQWEENTPNISDPNLIQLENLGYFVVQTGLTKSGIYVDRIAIHYSILEHFVDYFSPVQKSDDPRAQKENYLINKSEIDFIHPLGCRKEIQSRAPKIIEDSELLNTLANDTIKNNKFSINVYANLLRSCSINYNTKFFLNKQNMWVLSEALFQALKREGNLILFGEKIEDNIPFLLYVSIRSIIFNSHDDIIKNILFNPESQVLYYILSESISPYSEKELEIIRKLTLIRRSHLCVENKDPARSVGLIKIWNQTLLNFFGDDQKIDNYPFPLVIEKNLLKQAGNSNARTRKPVYFLSTPSSGTQTLLYFLSHLTGSQFHQYTRVRLQQKLENLKKDVCESVEKGLSIHSHVPLPEDCVRILTEAGYKIVVLTRDPSSIAESSTRHASRRQSFYPVFKRKREHVDRSRRTYLAVEKFCQDFKEDVNVKINYLQIQDSLLKVIQEINEKNFQHPEGLVHAIYKAYGIISSRGGLNYRKKTDLSHDSV